MFEINAHRYHSKLNCMKYFHLRQRFPSALHDENPFKEILEYRISCFAFAWNKCMMRHSILNLMKSFRLWQHLHSQSRRFHSYLQNEKCISRNIGMPYLFCCFSLKSMHDVIIPNWITWNLSICGISCIRDLAIPIWYSMKNPFETISEYRISFFAFAWN